jgi:hypothetical protein
MRGGDTGYSSRRTLDTGGRAQLYVFFITITALAGEWVLLELGNSTARGGETGCF